MAARSKWTQARPSGPVGSALQSASVERHTRPRFLLCKVSSARIITPQSDSACMGISPRSSRAAIKARSSGTIRSKPSMPPPAASRASAWPAADSRRPRMPSPPWKHRQIRSVPVTAIGCPRLLTASRRMAHCCPRHQSGFIGRIQPQPTSACRHGLMVRCITRPSL